MHKRMGRLSSTSWVTSLVRRTVMLRKLSGGPHCRVHRCESQRMLHLVRPPTGGCSARNDSAARPTSVYHAFMFTLPPSSRIH
ncbi:uncharacterized protein STEHIDRAFT_169989 [Stereum hirsutum FP-91666 SS1]|uniref:uncharacterized protein n=1 Tax=Stereum hirsutum (strain FP-91666) TaxID=721885 RepID=UPI0004449F31|nr:uncharacterized protein STEHIDRAFT_169989 [Stereum hirsutum FP-91666 SS1]EIM84230.1 hypothetical protein STEHIDRAFT_169989 [Stereum hirsutum FP-91666 SS1]